MNAVRAILGCVACILWMVLCDPLPSAYGMAALLAWLAALVGTGVLAPWLAVKGVQVLCDGPGGESDADRWEDAGERPGREPRALVWAALGLSLLLLPLAGLWAGVLLTCWALGLLAALRDTGFASRSAWKDRMGPVLRPESPAVAKAIEDLRQQTDYQIGSEVTFTWRRIKGSEVSQHSTTVRFGGPPGQSGHAQKGLEQEALRAWWPDCRWLAVSLVREGCLGNGDSTLDDMAQLVSQFLRGALPEPVEAAHATTLESMLKRRGATDVERVLVAGAVCRHLGFHARVLCLDARAWLALKIEEGRDRSREGVRVDETVRLDDGVYAVYRYDRDVRGFMPDNECSGAKQELRVIRMPPDVQAVNER